MKKTGKALLLSLCAVLLVTASVLGTMAYLTSQDQVVNTFTVGSVKISLDEADTDENGVPIQDADRVKDNEYHLMPGHTYTKDPTVHVEEGSEDCYIRMFVKIENWGTLAERLPEGTLPETLCSWNDDFWTNYSFKAVNEDAVLEFRHDAVITTETEIPALFEDITLPGTVEDLTDLDTVKIIVTAEAIQADGFTTDADAFAALDDAVAQQ